MNKVLVFGGFGFLGYYLVKELLSRGYQITVADIQSNPEIINEVKFIYCDISVQSDIKKTFESDNFDVVYNLAGFANLDDAVKAPLRTMQLNVIGNMYILDLCVAVNIKKFIYASSAYAMSNKGSFYGISKLASEKIVEEYHEKYNLNFIILRYGSVYAERSYHNNYIYNLVRKAIKDGMINHNGDGKEIREYIHAGDAARLSVDVIETNQFDNSHVVLTGTERMQRSELFNIINEILNNNLSITYSGDSNANHHYKFTPYSFMPSSSRKLVANPHIDMGQGLLECIRAVYHEKDAED